MNQTQIQTDNKLVIVVTGNRIALLGMPDIELLYTLSVMCSTVDEPQKCSEINS